MAVSHTIAICRTGGIAVTWVEEAHRLKPQLVKWRRHLHQFPELSFHELDTQQYLLDELSAMGLVPRVIGKTGVVVDMGQGEGGVAIRADIDALPLHEESGHPFRSQRPGVMHACGHDGHTAILLGVAKLLSAQADSLPGRIRLMFQPAEELMPGGAKLLLAEGILEGIDRVLGLHLASDLPTGQVGTLVGAATATADHFTIEIEGRGGHGSQPERAIDPIVVAAELVLSLQSIVSRNVSPRHAAVITVGTLQSGTNFNIIAPRAKLTGTVRTFDGQDRRLIEDRMTTLVSHVSAAHGASGRLEYTHGYPSVVNSPDETRLAEEVIMRILGVNALVHPDPLMAGEDFSYYLEQVPGTFLNLGCGNPAVGAVYPHHHPQFTLDEDALPIGVSILTSLGLEFLMWGKSH